MIASGRHEEFVYSVAASRSSKNLFTGPNRKGHEFTVARTPVNAFATVEEPRFQRRVSHLQ
ncbi:MAG: hypothetical protein DMG98_01500 [Acidobacteria bacterium]|nr:MAG: hypothetical protein DMG98_01500 [Acidobacteriota bacterium]